MKILHSLWKGLWGQAYLLLVLTTLMWAGNGIAGRLAVDQVSPMVLTCLRWVIVVAILTPLVGRQVVAEWPQLKERWLFTTLMGIFGLTAFNALFYAAAHHTSAINITHFPGFDPGLRACRDGAILPRPRDPAADHRHDRDPHRCDDRVREGGLADPEDPRAQYRRRVDADRLRVLCRSTPSACATARPFRASSSSRPSRSWPSSSLPLLGMELVQGTAQFPTPKGWLILLYVALMPSLLSQIFFIRGVELIGPARAGLFVNLVPVFGALLAVMLLGEPFALYHAIGLALVLGGIWLSERKR